MAQTIALEGIISCSVFHFHEDGLIFRFHELRHTFATNLIQAGVDVKVVSQLLGHSSVKITYDTYVHMGVDRAVEAVARIG